MTTPPDTVKVPREATRHEQARKIAVQMADLAQDLTRANIETIYTDLLVKYADEIAAPPQPEPVPAWVAAFLNRRTEVENALRTAVRDGTLIDPLTAKQLADKLGIPDEYRDPPQPEPGWPDAQTAKRDEFIVSKGLWMEFMEWLEVNYPLPAPPKETKT